MLELEAASCYHSCLCPRLSFVSGDSRLSVKGQIVHTVGFVGLEVYSITTQPCCYSLKTAIDDTETNGHDCVPTKLYFQQQVAGGILPLN